MLGAKQGEDPTEKVKVPGYGPLLDAAFEKREGARFFVAISFALVLPATSWSFDEAEPPCCYGAQNPERSFPTRPIRNRFHCTLGKRKKEFLLGNLRFPFHLPFKRTAEEEGKRVCLLEKKGQVSRPV